MGANKFCFTRKVTSVFHIIVNALSLCLLLFVDKCLCHYCMLLCKCDFKQLHSEVRTLHTKRCSCRHTCSPFLKFYVRGSVHRKSMSIIVQQDATMYVLLYFCKLLYMFRLVTPPIIRSTYNCNYSIWHWSNFGKCSV
jgi:hypothetical protein